ncbi:F-box/kelch-repeat protein At3g23880-like [Actinidia eriantha]|uniref:F-box/kelch-repeat protein At3g23880-like n=1 Tax=Actinidia eriantha TaxID=165200 RepID=UPI00258F7180|nr:F-box/kelch-repeat protein At3g23880-like [Actinidia eriantha]
MGSSNGFLLVRVGGDFFLWNPLNRCCVKVLSNERYHYNCKSCTIVSGLCYDSSADDYKVVVVNSWSRGYIHRHDSFGMVGSCRSKTWTEILFPSNWQKVRSGTTIDDRLHWLVAETGEDFSFQSYLIVYFDPQSNGFGKLPMPQRKEDILLGLGVLNGCLSLAFCRGKMEFDASDIEVLAMKKYGDETSWTSLFVIPNLFGLCPSHMLVPLCTTEKGEVLIRWDKEMQRRILAYNPKRKSYRNLPIPNNNCGVDVTMFVGSMVSLPNYNLEEEEYSEIFRSGVTRKWKRKLGDAFFKVITS